MILKQAEQWPFRTGMNWDNKVGLQVAHGVHHSYLIDPPVNYNPEAAKHRAEFGRPDQHLLFTFPNGDPEHAWNFHSAHDSLEDAQAAAEAHNGGQMITAASPVISVPTEHLTPHYTLDYSKELDPQFVEDIKQHGVREPVQMETDGHLGRLWDGNHRVAAAAMAGVQQVPVTFIDRPSRYMQLYGRHAPPLHPSVQQQLAKQVTPHG